MERAPLRDHRVSPATTSRDHRTSFRQTPPAGHVAPIPRWKARAIKSSKTIGEGVSRHDTSARASPPRRPGCEKQLTPTKRGRRSPPRRFLGVQRAAKTHLRCLPLGVAVCDARPRLPDRRRRQRDSFVFKGLQKQSTPNKRARRSPPSAQRRATSVFIRVAPATIALDGERRGCFSTPRPTSPTERTRPAASAKRNKILKDERRPRFSPSLCHKNENFETRTLVTVRVYFRLPHLYLSLELYDPHVNGKFSNTVIVPSLAVTSTSPIVLCDSHRHTNVLTRHSDLPYRFFLMGDDANMPGHARPSLPGSEPVRPHHPLSHTIKDDLKIASSSFRVQHPKQQHGC